MTQPSVVQLKTVLQAGSDEVLAKFLRGYSVGFAAHLFIESMEANQRIEFLSAIAKTYPDDWKQAVELLSR